MQLAIGDAIAISTMRQKNFGEKEFKKFHPSGSIGAKLKTVEDLMLKGKKIPFINENIRMVTALKSITSELKKLKKLNDEGVISKKEFNLAKKKLLG